MFISKKIKAGSLQFAILISAIIAVLLATFIILIHSYQLFSKKSDLLIETIWVTDNTIAHALDNFQIAKDTISIEIDKKKQLKGKLHHSYWGMYGRVFSRSKVKNYIFEKAALTGSFDDRKDCTALYLKEANKPLILVGNTKIQGKVYLPQKGVRAGNISGNSYYGSQLIYGTKYQSKEILPALPKKLTNYLKTILEKPILSSNDDFIEIDSNTNHQNSFFNHTKYIYQQHELHLEGLRVTGNIIIKSDTKIIVGSTAFLTDVILIAPEIIVENNVNGTFQAIASKNIKLGKDCQLKYPSALVLIPKKNRTVSSRDREVITNSKILIETSSIVKGVVCYLGAHQVSNRFEPQIILDTDTIIEGIVYCDQNIELLGTVYGSVFTSGFITKQFGSVYQNHIFNGRILTKGLSEAYIGFPMETKKHKVAKWLY